jgi:phosphatidylserine/phosphatidylglycerophosphate/cardiolipin synthase-like enzyme
MPNQPHNPRRVSAGATLFALAALLGAYLALAYGPRLLRAAPPASAGPITAFFTTPTLRYPDDPRDRADSPLLDAVLADIEGARQAVDVASFDFDLPPLADALLRAARRGVAVRAVFDSENLADPETSLAAGRLEQAGIPIAFDRRAGFMHHKFLVIDRRVIWAGSWNMTENDTFRNNNNMLRFASQALAARYAAEFEQMAGGAFGSRKAAGAGNALRVGRAQVEVYFSPGGGAEARVAALVGRARRSIRFMAFSFTSARVSQAMAARAADGVGVRGVVETRNALSAAKALDRLRAAGAAAAEDGNCYQLHHKVIIIDDSIVITGSFNFTASAETENDENLLVIVDPAIAAVYRAEFDRVWEAAQRPLRCDS